MSKIELNFCKIVQDSQDYGSNNEHMISRVYFTVDEKEYECNVRQPYGESFSFEKDPIEVEAPEELKKIINYGQFRDEVENYFRKAVSANAHGIRIDGGMNIRMRNNTIENPHKTSIDKAGISGAW
ncbi:hypothetical protein Q4534_00470 [Cyclobacterium sp. 1_MG-2023]|uniref:hypothetical protein n=1 Tax=Cyclobacterium sp. 1_MG-2023 TaxID=3062681 RepID=UPI0026E18ECD|nr:hypothetical protein [Cyclobacterium sp. 1_MG-2023]MDO6435852.1 hypothetical protein [Cyclobacterium sp. 1_MG-2023]